MSNSRPEIPILDTEPRFRILSLDGGGLRGIFAAAFLAGLEQSTGKRIVDHFDLIVGTSTGGITALGLGLGLSASEMLRFYEAKGSNLFPATGTLQRTNQRLKQLFRPKQTARPVPETPRRTLESLFGDRRIGEAQTRLVIVSYDRVRNDVHLFKTAHIPTFRIDYKELAADAAVATSAAPFPPTATDGTYIDGSVWASCPATVGILEAIGVLGRQLYEIDVLSVGAVENPHAEQGRKRAAGLLPRAANGVELLMQAQVRGAIAQANLLTEHRMLRVNEVLRPGRRSFRGAPWIAELKALGLQRARASEPEVSRRFLAETAPPFTPFHRVAEGLEIQTSSTP